MKHYFKKLSIFLYSCLTLFVCSCSEEKDFVKEQNRISTVNLEDLPFLQKELNKDKSKGVFSKESTEYYLDKINIKDIIQIIDQQGFKNYTFALNIKKQDTLFNLCAKETVEGYDYSLLKYSTTSLDQWIEDIKNTSNSLIVPDIKAESLDNRAIATPISLCFRFHTVCPSGLHDLSQCYQCDFPLYQWMETFEVYACDSGSGGGGGPSNSGTTITTTAPNVANDDVNSDETPCPGDPIKKPKICPSSPNNPSGGTFGCTRNDPKKTCNGYVGKKKHGGIDVAGKVGDKVYNMHGGTVVDARNSMGNIEYKAKSLGNYIEIESIIDGETVRIKYCHLGNVQFQIGDTVTQGTHIGNVGRSGNAAASGVTTHLHIQSKMTNGNNWTPTNPINYFNTTFNPTTFNPETDCN